MTTRREIKKNTKYLHDYETTEINTDRRRSRTEEEVRAKPKRPLRGHRGIYSRNDKEEANIIPEKVNGCLPKRTIAKHDEEEEEAGGDEDNDDAELEGDEDEGREDIEDQEREIEEPKNKKLNIKDNKKDNGKLRIEGIYLSISATTDKLTILNEY